MSPLLSVVIPAYNVERYISKSVASALSQTVQSLEVIVVDDGSSDRTAAIVGAMTDPRVWLVRQQNRGLAGARNGGIRVAQGKYIGFLDADDLWEPVKAERHISVMERNPEIGLTYSNSRYIDEQDQPTGRLLVSIKKHPSVRQMVKRNLVGNGSTPIMLRSCFERVGLFDESLRDCDDWEMWVRFLRDSGMRAALIPEFLTLYRVNYGSLSHNSDHFLANAHKAMALIEQRSPGLSAHVIRQGLATAYRIASTKQLLFGDKRKAIQLLSRSIAICPWLPLVDARLIATASLMLVPTQTFRSRSSSFHV